MTSVELTLSLLLAYPVGELSFPRGEIWMSSGALAAPAGWTTYAPREEIRPQFAYDATGGPDGKGCFTIRSDNRAGIDGCWRKAFHAAQIL